MTRADVRQIQQTEGDTLLSALCAARDAVRAGDLSQAHRMADLVDSLDIYLKAGGLPPLAWRGPGTLTATAVEPDGTVTDHSGSIGPSGATVFPGPEATEAPSAATSAAAPVEIADDNGAFLLFGDTDPEPLPPSITTPVPVPASTVAGDAYALTPSSQASRGPARAPERLDAHRPSRVGWGPGWSLDQVNNTSSTSKAMFDKVLKQTGQANRLLWLFFDLGEQGATDDEIEARTGWSHQSASACRNGLMNRGYLVASGRKRLTRAGKNEANVYVLTEVARLRCRDGVEKRPATD